MAAYDRNFFKANYNQTEFQNSERPRPSAINNTL